MTRKRYRCTHCSGVFEYDHHPSIEADPLPTDEPCPHCGVSAESEPAVVAPHIGLRIAKTVDTLHRDMETGEQFRADIMSEKFGLDREEARQLVTTNSLDSLREGDVSAIPVDNQVSRQIAAHPSAFGWQGGAAQGAALSPHVQSGVFPNAGARAMQQLRAIHPHIVAGSGHKGVVTSSLPALETTAPGYRSRV